MSKFSNIYNECNFSIASISYTIRSLHGIKYLYVCVCMHVNFYLKTKGKCDASPITCKLVSMRGVGTHINNSKLFTGIFTSYLQKLQELSWLCTEAIKKTNCSVDLAFQSCIIVKCSKHTFWVFAVADPPDSFLFPSYALWRH